MGAKYCKNDRCSGKKDKPCLSSDDCNFFIWDIDRELGQKLVANSAVKTLDVKTQTQLQEKIRKLIAQKWFLTLNELCQRVNIGIDTMMKILRGYNISAKTLIKVIEYLEAYEGEQNGFGE